MGRVGLKALIYFEVVTTIALVLGLLVVNIRATRRRHEHRSRHVDTKSLQVVRDHSRTQGIVDFFLHIIPATVVGAFAEGEILQVLFFAILFAFALCRSANAASLFSDLIDIVSHALFGSVGIIMQVAPLGAFGAMAFTIGKYGVGSLSRLAKLMASSMRRASIFVFGVLGTIARFSGFSIWKFIRYIKEELLIVLGTSSSESVAASADGQARESRLRGVGGRPRHSDGLFVQPRRHLHILTMAALFLAQATNTAAHPVAARLASLGLSAAHLERRRRRHRQRLHRPCRDACLRRHDPCGRPRPHPRRRSLHVGGAGADQPVGNGVATIVVAKWEGALDEARMRQLLEHETTLEAEAPESVLPPPAPLIS